MNVPTRQHIKRYRGLGGWGSATLPSKQRTRQHITLSTLLISKLQMSFYSYTSKKTRHMIAGGHCTPPDPPAQQSNVQLNKEGIRWKNILLYRYGLGSIASIAQFPRFPRFLNRLITSEHEWTYIINQSKGGWGGTPSPSKCRTGQYALFILYYFTNLTFTGDLYLSQACWFDQSHPDKDLKTLLDLRARMWDRRLARYKARLHPTPPQHDLRVSS